MQVSTHYAKELKQHLEQQIQKLVLAYSEITGFTVTSIDVDYYTRLGNPNVDYIIKTNVEV